MTSAGALAAAGLRGGALLTRPPTVYGGGAPELTKNELRILQALAEKRGSVATREELMLRLWQTDSFVDENTLTVNVTRPAPPPGGPEPGRAHKDPQGLGYNRLVRGVELWLGAYSRSAGGDSALPVLRRELLRSGGSTACPGSFLRRALCRLALPCLTWGCGPLSGPERELELLRRNIRASIDAPPEPRGPWRRTTTHPARVWDEKAKLRRNRASRREAEDYYAMWVHQIKTPIAALRLLLQRGAAAGHGGAAGGALPIEQYVEMVLSYQRLSAGRWTSSCAGQSWPRKRSCVRKYARPFIAKAAARAEETGLEADRREVAGLRHRAAARIER